MAEKKKEKMAVLFGDENSPEGSDAFLLQDFLGPEDTEPVPGTLYHAIMNFRNLSKFYKRATPLSRKVIKGGPGSGNWDQAGRDGGSREDRSARPGKDGSAPEEETGHLLDDDQVP